ncbi:MAG TPA: glutamate-1-semialdehyde 2,1-aminomutase, partial [Planctomycetaceae bacterium]|nr:glutamate-1-semialdehyde 2,1-aminomutase [Planctomycetaceae bacterium]
GNEYIEYGQGNRAIGLGHAFPEVLDAVRKVLGNGSNFTRPAPIEIQAAEALLELVPAADMVKFCKDGSDATTAATKLARAWTGRDLLACCHDQPFFATNDWFIGTTPMDAGIPQRVKDLTLTFGYNDISSLEALFQQYPEQIAGVIMEPAKYEEPTGNFLHQVQQLCEQNGSLFILDEMITGFRWNLSGGQAEYDIQPDLSCWGKALGNGFSVSALAGKRQYMELGGLHHDRERVFLLSTTHGAETHSLAAAIATIGVYQREPVIETLYARGQRLLEEGTQLIRSHGLERHLQIIGRPCCLVLTTLDADFHPSQAMRSLWLQETIKRGILMTSLVVSYTHSDQDIDQTLQAMDGAMVVYRKALEGGVENYLVGSPSQVVYRRFNSPQTTS